MIELLKKTDDGIFPPEVQAGAQPRGRIGPRLQQKCFNFKPFKNSIVYRWPSLWNGLSVNLRKQKKKNLFMNEIKNG